MPTACTSDDAGGGRAVPSPKIGEISKGPIRVPRGATPCPRKEEYNDEENQLGGRMSSGQKLKRSTTESPLSAAQMDNRRPLSASNTPARKIPPPNATPTRARDALDAVLEAVLDVLLMEHVLELEEEQTVPFAWHSPVTDLSIPMIYDSDDDEKQPGVAIFCGACVAASFLDHDTPTDDSGGALVVESLDCKQQDRSGGPDNTLSL